MYGAAGGGSAGGERYTAVFTGLLDLKKPGEYPYLVMDAEGSGIMRRGRPPYGEMGRELGFGELPEACRTLVLERYRALWNLPEPGSHRRVVGIGAGRLA